MMVVVVVRIVYVAVFVAFVAQPEGPQPSVQRIVQVCAQTLQPRRRRTTAPAAVPTAAAIAPAGRGACRGVAVGRQCTNRCLTRRHCQKARHRCGRHAPFGSGTHI
jgi:hypothetical protein